MFGRMSQTWTISELAQDFDLTPRAIRFYEDVGLLEPAREGQRRIYTLRDHTRLRLIIRGKRLGFSLQEIKEILDMYDTPGEAAQLGHFIDKVRERKVALRQQQEDIAVILDELDIIETQCADILRSRGIEPSGG